MEEQQKPKNVWDRLLGDELFKGMDDFEGESKSDPPKVGPKEEQPRAEPLRDGVTIEFYQDLARDILYSLAYETRYHKKVQAHKPKGGSIRWAGGSNFPEVPDLEGFVNEFTGQLEHRGFRPNSPEKIDIGDDNKSGLLYKHEYNIRSEVRRTAMLRVSEELSGILDYLEQKYKQT